MSGIFLAGAAREDITPKVGTLLYGYNPHQVSTSIHDPLQVTCAAFSDGIEKALLLTVTVGDMQTALANEIREKLSNSCGVPISHILLSSTHTHSAPNVAGMEGWGEVDRPYCDEILIPSLFKASKAALERMTPAVIGVGTTNSRIGVNRRQLNRDGNVVLGQNPWGCYDPTMTVVSIRTEKGEGILNLIHYGAHGTAAGCNHEISRDWSGVMTDRIEKETGVLTAFWNGAIGDVGPRLTNGGTTGDISYVEELGAMAASDALLAYREIGGFHPGTLKLFTGEIHLPYRNLPSLETVQDKLSQYLEPEKLFNYERLEYNHYRDLETLLKQEKTEHPTHFIFPQTLVSLGDLLFVPFPFEMFSEITLRLKAYSPWPYTLCLSNTNGYHAYLPSQDQICRGGYEVACF